MIRSLSGTVTEIEFPNVVLDVRGVGYLLHTPIARHPLNVGDNLTFHTYLAVRENAMDLYGFLDKSELVIFELLLTIPKIGPKSALQILTQADPKLLTDCIRANDAEQLHKISGLGRKTAENVVSSLQNKLDHLPKSGETEVFSNLSEAERDAIDALITLGYDPKEARNFVGKQEKGLEAKALIQAVLKQLPTH